MYDFRVEKKRERNFNPFFPFPQIMQPSQVFNHSWIMGRKRIMVSQNSRKFCKKRDRWIYSLNILSRGALVKFRKIAGPREYHIRWMMGLSVAT